MNTIEGEILVVVSRVFIDAIRRSQLSHQLQLGIIQLLLENQDGWT